MNREIAVLLRLLNGRRFAAEMAGSAAAVKGFTKEVETAATASSGLAAASATARGTLFAIGAASRIAGYGLAAMGTIVTGIGLNFDATMESNTLAFQKFTGSVGSAKILLNQLFEVAAATPFTFADITTASRRLMAFGFNAQDTIKWVKLLGDTISYTGGTADEVFRAVKAVGEIRGIGRLQQRQLLQLTNLGINAGPLLAKGLGITEKKLHEQGRKGLISADRALQALSTQLAARYGGGAAVYSKTFIGQINKVKDYAQRASGQLVEPLFQYLRDKVFPKINKWLSGPAFKEAIPKIRDAFITLGKVIAAPFAIGIEAGKELYAALKPLAPFINNVLMPALQGMATGVGITVVVAFKILTGVLNVFAKVLGFIGKQLGGTGDGFKILGTIIGVVFAAKILGTLALLGRFPGVFRAIGFAAKLLLIPIALVRAAIAGLGTASVLASASNVGLLGGLGAMAGRLAGILKFAGPVGAFLVGSGLLNPDEAGSKQEDAFVQRRHDLSARGINPNTGKKMAHPKMFMLGAKDARRYSDFFKNDNTEFSMAAESIGEELQNPRVKVNSDWRKIIRGYFKSRGWNWHDVPGLMSGGSVIGGGWAMVGERGPELAHLKSGSTVVSNSALEMMNAVARASLRDDASKPADGMEGHHTKFQDIRLVVHSPIYINKRQVGEAVGEYVAEKAARR